MNKVLQTLALFLIAIFSNFVAKALCTASISAGGSTTFCSGGSVNLTATMAGSGLTYEWRLNGNPISGATNQVYSATTSGSYTAVVTNNSPCTATSNTIVVTVNTTPTATITPQSSTSFCAGGSVVLTGSSGTGYTYQWKNNNINVSGATNTNYTVTTSGNYTLQTTLGTCTVTSAAQAVTVGTLSNTITANGPTTICSGSNVVLSTNPGPGMTYQWKLNNVNISGATTSSYTVTTSGSYTVYAGIISQPTCNSTSTAQVVTVNPSPIATTTASGSTTFCSGGSVTLNGNTGTGLTYQWQLNGSNISGATTSSYSATNSGSYTYQTTNANNCTTTSTAQVVTANPVASSTVTPSGSLNLCTGGSVTLAAPIGTGITYQWKNNNINITGATNSSYLANAAGSYTVQVNNSFNCPSTSTAQVVVVNTLPTSTITPASTTTFCAGSSVILNGNTGTGLTYQWKLNGNNIIGATTASYTATTTGSYTVAITNSTNCTATSTAEAVTVTPLPTATITPVGTSTFCTGGSVVMNANTGTGLTYQWKLNGNNITGATTASYTATTTGSYTFVVTNTNNCSSNSNTQVVTANPVASSTVTPSGSLNLCTGGSVTLAAPTGTGITYQWKNNNINITGATNSSYLANAAGSYTVQVNNSFNCPSTSTAQVVVVNTLPTSTITPASTTTFCAGSSVILNGNTGTGLTYQWLLNGSNVTGATNPSYTANVSGNYTLQVTNSSNCSAVSSAQSVTVNPLPTSTISNSSSLTICSGNSVVLNANTGTGLTYQWRLNGNNISGATTSSFSASNAGSYSVQVTNTNNCNNISSPLVVTVKPLPTAAITNPGNPNFCQGGTVTLNANTGTGFSYQWFDGSNPLVGATASTFTVGTPGTNAVQITDSNTCSKLSVAKLVTVYPLPSTNVQATGSTSICSGSTVTFYTPGTTGNQYQWFNGGTPIATATNSSYIAQSAGNYNVQITNMYNCSATSTPIPVYVNPNPTASITSVSGPTNFCQGFTISFTANTGSELNYQWYNSSNPIIGATNISYTANSSGSYYVKVKNQFNCSANSIAYNANVLPSPVPVITQVGLTLSTSDFSTYQWYYNGAPITGANGKSIVADKNGIYRVVVTDGFSCPGSSANKAVTQVGINDISIDVFITVVPNPSNGLMTIKSNSGLQTLHFTLFDALGRVSGQYEMSNNTETSIDFSSMNNGIYLLQFVDNYGRKGSIRLMKQ